MAWKFITNQVRANGETTEAAVRDQILAHFAKHGLTTYHPPIMGVNANSGDPHYETAGGPKIAMFFSRAVGTLTDGSGDLLLSREES